MNYQQPIYDQNGRFLRNHTLVLPNFSSDVCIFNMPYFDINGADKINCVEASVTITDPAAKIDYLRNNTVNCFTSNDLSGTCFNNITWDNNIYEDGNLVYSNTYYTSSGFTDEPSITQVFNELTNSFDTLGYDYDVTGNTFTFEQIQNVKTLTIELTTEIDILENCPLTGASSGSTFTGTCSGTSISLDVDFTGLTASSPNVYSITGQSSIDLDITFTSNTSTFLDTNALFRFEIYKYSNDLNRFIRPSLYQSDLYDWSTFSATSAVTVSIPVDNLNIDGDYLLKGYYLHNICTEFANRLGKTYSTSNLISGDAYDLYKANRDFYFVAFTPAEEPEIGTSPIPETVIGGLNSVSLLLDGTTNSFQLPTTLYSTDYVISLNGLTLAEGYDYEFSVLTLPSGQEVQNMQLSGDTYSGDILTYAYVSSAGNNFLKSDIIDVTSIPSGPTDGQGSNKIYYNTTTGKYEAYTSLTPVSSNDILVTVNGATLAHNVDYYQSTTNAKRIIFEGSIIEGDIINIIYNGNTNITGNVFGTPLVVYWTVPTTTQGPNGFFTIELSTNSDFTNIVNSVVVPYVANANGYTESIDLIGSYGDTLYYRVKNEKWYKDICGNPIITTAYSEIIDITLQTNVINSY